MMVIYSTLCIKICIKAMYLSICLSEFFKQFSDGESKKGNITQMLSVAQQINKLGQGE